MTYDFDRVLDRTNTHSYKWDQAEKLFGSKDILPLWVADMDFESPPAVKEALVHRAEHGIYGYSISSESYIESIQGWFGTRHGWDIPSQWIAQSPGIVTTLSLAVDLFSEPGAEVILQSPVYYPFYDVIKLNGRKVADNPLVIRNGRYEMDYEQLEGLMKNGAKLLLLCSPHNPGGRVWEREELLRLGELCLQYGVTVVSDEIHCDLALPGHKHIPFASLSKEISDITLMALAPTKTFNLPGIHSSFIVASSPEIKRKFEARIKTLSLHMASYFAQDAVEAAYRKGGEWLDELIAYLNANIEYAVNYLAQNLPQVKPMKPEATYLLWVDCRNLGLDGAGLKRLMYREAGVAFNEGSVYGSEGEGYLRINVACPRSILTEALERFCKAATSYVK
ncbi:pyridoxal phosphate-dependent aminotransferase [Paenibacillus sp. HN-1]|uniref:MalY/PatB family protein n=1 Tax=Paenibacillus TaxID=44249 RepID=UPI001CA9C490|nr:MULTISPECIES: MalY/PatB family protein [Paenibacillus]MBY9082500.1 pyridoxal phosphate-dependent aminotransferase [Paenibacillus sp. CGMCC 1.18879]MBY9084859.1 pyridoxal phosphate-dependent aminotransferase [Paenibacillus sinensis]